jgi:hypothetical protein
MADPNTDLLGEVQDASQLAAELRNARARIEDLMQAHRRYADAFGRIASAGGLLDSQALEELTERVVERLRPSPPADLLTPYAPDPEAAGLICDACGETGATDLGDGAVLCRRCSGEEMLAEARAQGLLH